MSRLDRIAALERAFDGPVPETERATAWHGSVALLDRARSVAAGLALGRRICDAVREISARRRALSGASAITDQGLDASVAILGRLRASTVSASRSNDGLEWLAAPDTLD